MELQQLRYFLEVANSQHISKSAQRLHIAQPALSQSIHRLERELGVKLFEAKGRNIVLTEYGKHLKNKIEPMLNTLDIIPNELKAMYDESYSIININVLAASTVITQAIIEYQKHNPSARFQLMQKDEESYDIKITTDIKYKADNDNEYILKERIFLAVPNNEKYKLINAISLNEVEMEGFITLSGSKQFRYICDRYCHQAGITPNYIFESDSPAAVKNTIGANIGVGFWPEFSWGELKDDKVKLLEIKEPNCFRNVIVSCDNIENKNVKAFYEYLTKYLKKLSK